MKIAPFNLIGFQSITDALQGSAQWLSREITHLTSSFQWSTPASKGDVRFQELLDKVARVILWVTLPCVLFHITGWFLSIKMAMQEFDQAVQALKKDYEEINKKCFNPQGEVCHPTNSATLHTSEDSLKSNGDDFQKRIDALKWPARILKFLGQKRNSVNDFQKIAEEVTNRIRNFHEGVESLDGTYKSMFYEISCSGRFLRINGQGDFKSSINNLQKEAIFLKALGQESASFQCLQNIVQSFSVIESACMPEKTYSILSKDLTSFLQLNDNSTILSLDQGDCFYDTACKTLHLYGYYKSKESENKPGELEYEPFTHETLRPKVIEWCRTNLYTDQYLCGLIEAAIDITIEDMNKKINDEKLTIELLGKEKTERIQKEIDGLNQIIQYLKGTNKLSKYLDLAEKPHFWASFPEVYAFSKIFNVHVIIRRLENDIEVSQDKWEHYNSEGTGTDSPIHIWYNQNHFYFKVEKAPTVTPPSFP